MRGGAVGHSQRLSCRSLSGKLSSLTTWCWGFLFLLILFSRLREATPRIRSLSTRLVSIFLHFCSLPFVLLTETVISSFGSEFWEESRGRSGTMEVQKNRWEEVEVLQRRLGGLQILREAQAQGQEVFNKDRGNAFAHQPILQLLLAHLFIFVILHFYTIGLALGSSISLVRRGQRALQWTGECR